MIELILEYPFARRALAAGLIVGLIIPLLGVFVVARRLSVVGEALSHMSFSGIAFGVFAGSLVPFLQPVSPPLYGMIFAVLGAFLIEGLRRIYRHFSELAIPLVLSFSMGSAVVLVSAADGFNVDLAGYLFGNLLAVNKQDLTLTVFSGGIVLAAVCLLYKELLAVTFDEEHAAVFGLRSRWVHIVFIVVLALAVSVSVRTVGVLLVTGLMVLPVAAALIYARGFKQAIVYAVCISESSIIAGFALSYYFGLASGGAIVLVAFVFLLVFIGARRAV
ncbi:metal ABC transporter permease [Bacillaceae bacterium]